MSAPVAQVNVSVEEALQYDADSLEAAIEKCQANIKLFKDTIANEKNTIARYEKMIEIIKIHAVKK